MANRRMFSLLVIDTDMFLDMPLSSQALYFHLSMRADDDGFIGNAKKIQRMVGSSDDDFKILLAKGFIFNFETGVCVVKHWRIHNYIQKDRYSETLYKEEKSQLIQDKNSVYQIEKDSCIQDVYRPDTQDRLELGKDRLELGKDNNTKPKRFKKPTVEEIQTYCKERNNNIDANQFYDFYEARGWKIGKNSMKDWKASVRTWERNNFNKPQQSNMPSKRDYQAPLTQKELDAYDR